MINWPTYTVQKNFRSRRWGSSLPGLRTRDPPLSPPSTWAEIFRRTCLQSSRGGRGGCKIFKQKFWSTFSPNQAILSTFRFFHFFQKKINCGHYFCLPSTKIVVTKFACHLHNSSGMCLPLARTNKSKWSTFAAQQWDVGLSSKSGPLVWSK